MKRKTGAERRKYKRIKKILGINIIKVGKKRTLPKFDHEVGLDFSPAGVLISSEKPIKLQESLRIKMAVASADDFALLEVAGKVAWCARQKARRAMARKEGGYHLGVAFQRLTPSNLRVLKKFYKE